MKRLTTALILVALFSLTGCAQVQRLKARGLFGGHYSQSQAYGENYCGAPVCSSRQTPSSPVPAAPPASSAGEYWGQPVYEPTPEHPTDRHIETAPTPPSPAEPELLEEQNKSNSSPLIPPPPSFDKDSASQPKSSLISRFQRLTQSLLR